MVTQLTCNVADLSSFIPTTENPWDSEKVKHLYRRIGIDASKTQIDAALTQTPSDFIDAIVTAAENEPPAPAPDWAYWTKADFENSGVNGAYFSYRKQLSKRIFDRFVSIGLRERMAYFWSNHLVTQYVGYSSSAYSYQYYHVLEKHAMGDFKAMVSEIGLTAPMLLYLNGYQNRKGRPNENYARELYELFTLGVNNGYTQNDIVETARALTGYNSREEQGGPITFNPSKFDDGEKTIFGQTGNWGYNDVITILFEQRPVKIAKYICSKLYQFFIDQNPDQLIVNQLAQTFISNNFTIAPVLRQLLKSNHFFDDSVKGVVIKSPSDLFIGFINSTKMQVSENNDLSVRYHNWTRDMGQEPFNPPDVAGWQRDKDWISSTSITNRWRFLDDTIRRFWQHDKMQFRDFALELAGNSNDPAFVTKAIIDHLLCRPLHNEAEYLAATDVFKEEVPENYFEEGIWDLYWENADKQVRNLLYHIIRIPEFQLK